MDKIFLLTCAIYLLIGVAIYYSNKGVIPKCHTVGKIIAECFLSAVLWLPIMIFILVIRLIYGERK